ncbi:MAG: hypothetical protein FWD45_02215 [Coriobacteriia bacterium]|nr:hypothetical protein [Coriobacteriia bacterium]
MLKLIKYELKATARIFLIAYAALIVVSIFSAVTGASSQNSTSGMITTQGQVISSILYSLASIIFVILSMGVTVVTMIIFVTRFYRMFGSEGYLWFSLPVTANQHLICKVLVALFWTITSFNVLLGCAFMQIASVAGIGFFYELADLWKSIVYQGMHPVLWIVCFMILSLSSITTSIMISYAAIAIGPSMVKSRFGGTMLAGLLIVICTQFVSRIMSTFTSNTLAQLMDQLNRISSNAAFSAALDDVFVYTTVVSSLMSVIVSVALYILAHHFMSKRLNLA